MWVAGRRDEAAIACCGEVCATCNPFECIAAAVETASAEVGVAQACMGLEGAVAGFGAVRKLEQGEKREEPVELHAAARTKYRRPADKPVIRYAFRWFNAPL
jgi:hypothetical protein